MLRITRRLTALLAALAVCLTGLALLVGARTPGDMLLYREGATSSQSVLLDVRLGVTRPLLRTDNPYIASGWSPDGARIALHIGIDGGSDIAVTDTYGRMIRLLTRDQFSSNQSPLWVDNATLMFRARASLFTGVHLINIHDEVIHPLDMDPVGRFDVHPTAGVVYVETSNDLHVYDPSSGESTLLHVADTYTTTPRWSADGARVAFVQPVREGRGERLMVVDVDGGNVRELVRLRDIGVADWSPDGTRLAFPAINDLADHPGSIDIYVVDVAGGAIVNLTNTVFDDTFPVWSPDGARIAFSSNRDVGYDVYVMDSDGRNLRRLSYINNDALEPVWRPR